MEGNLMVSIKILSAYFKNESANLAKFHCSELILQMGLTHAHDGQACSLKYYL